MSQEIVMISCLQPFESEIVCINKTLAFFFFFFVKCQSFNVPHLCMKFRAMKLTKCNLLALKLARSMIYFPSISVWISYSVAFLNYQRASQLLWPANIHGVAGGWPQAQVAGSPITQGFFHRRRKNTAIHFKCQSSSHLKILSAFPHIP